MPKVKITYNQSINGNKDVRLKGLVPLVSALIEESTQQLDKKKSVIPFLFNEKKSDQHTEHLAAEDSLDLMDPTFDGDRPKTDKTNPVGEKSISHINFTKHIMFTEQVMEDAHYQLDPTIEVKGRSLPDSYYKTREKIAQMAYIEAENDSCVYRGEKINLKTYDGKPLFSSKHTYGTPNGHAFGEQSNLFYVVADKDTVHAGQIAEWLSQMAANINQMKNANGDAQDFDADTIFVPRGVNNTLFVDKVRRAIGSDYFPGTANNDINTQADQWNFVPLSLWNPTAPEIMVMSQDAKRMLKSMFYNRVTLQCKSWIDDNTGSLNYRARTRFGVGHFDYKHVVKLIVVADKAAGEARGATALY